MVVAKETPSKTVTAKKKPRQRSSAKMEKPVAKVRQSSPDQVVDAIISGIKTHKFVPGQRLIESDLVRNLKVSRGTVREALKRLAAENVVEIAPHKGAYIRSLSRAEVSQLLQCLEAMTGLGARLAAERINVGTNRKYFTKVVEKILDAEHMHDLFFSANSRVEFYRAMLEIGGNTELARIMPFIQIHQFRTQFHTHQTQKALGEHYSEYRVIAEAILEGDPRRAERAMRRHIRHTERRILQLPDEAFSG